MRYTNFINYFIFFFLLLTVNSSNAQLNCEKKIDPSISLLRIINFYDNYIGSVPSSLTNPVRESYIEIEELQPLEIKSILAQLSNYEKFCFYKDQIWNQNILEIQLERSKPLEIRNMGISYGIKSFYLNTKLFANDNLIIDKLGNLYVSPQIEGELVIPVDLVKNNLNIFNNRRWSTIIGNNLVLSNRPKENFSLPSKKLQYIWIRHSQEFLSNTSSGTTINKKSLEEIINKEDFLQINLEPKKSYKKFN